MPDRLGVPRQVVLEPSQARPALQIEPVDEAGLTGLAAALTAAFRGAEAVFVLVPPNFDPLPEFPEATADRIPAVRALEMLTASGSDGQVVVDSPPPRLMLIETML